MASVDWSTFPWAIPLAVLTYVGGFLSKPLSDYVGYKMLQRQVKVALYGEVATLYSTLQIYTKAAGEPDMRSLMTFRAFEYALSNANAYYTLKEKHFFEDFYRRLLGHNTDDTEPLDAKFIVQFVDEQIERRRLNWRLFNRHCDWMAKEHLKVVPKRLQRLSKHDKKLLKELETQLQTLEQYKKDENPPAPPQL